MVHFNASKPILLQRRIMPLMELMYKSVYNTARKKMSKFSYISSQRKSAYSYECVTDTIKRYAELVPNNEFFVYRGIDGTREVLTYKDLQEKATKLAKYIVRKGVKKGDIVALFGPNTIEWVIGETAIILAGGVAVGLSLTKTDARDIFEQFHNVGAKAIMVEPGKDDSYDSCLRKFLNHFKAQTNNADVLITFRKIPGFPDIDDLTTILDTEEEGTTLPDLFPEDPVVLFVTSGSTGKPKLVPHTHFDMMNVGEPANEILSSKFYSDRPFGWYGGTPILCICTGQPRVFSESSIAIDETQTMHIWDIIREENCTQASLSPYFIFDLINRRKEYKDSFRLNVLFVGGQVIDNVYSLAIGVFTNVLLITYGMTEVGVLTYNPVIAQNTVEKGIVGRPAGGVEIKVIDENDSTVNIGKRGEICVRSNRLFREYVQDEKSTQKAFMPGKWFRTGDYGSINEKGQLVVHGRMKEIIIRGGRNIMANAIEGVVAKMEGIRLVAVVAVPDKRLHEEICVCYTHESNLTVLPEDVKTFCKTEFSVESSEDGLGLLPTYFLKMDDFPLLSNGKPDKIKMKHKVIHQLGIEEN